MTVVRAFRGVRYDPERVDLAKVIVPPYDVISAEGREELYQRDPYNAVRLELTRDVKEEASTDYSEVSETLASWLASGVLKQDDEPALYALRQRFTAPGGETLAREGFYAALGLAAYSEQIVLPHERTLEGPRADRLKMLKATRANLSSVFVLYEDREQALAKAISSAFDAPDTITALDDAGIEHSLARIREPRAVGAIRDFLAERQVVMADGHHRYETALAYRDEQRAKAGRVDPNAPYESTLAYFSNAFAPGSLLLAIHRVVRRSAISDDGWKNRLSGWSAERFPVADAEAIPALLERHLAPLAGKPAFALDDGSGTLEIRWKEAPASDELMVSLLEREILGDAFGLDPQAIRKGAVLFRHDALEAAEEVRGGEGAVALYLNALTPDDVFRVTRAGELMPQKSTFFYPKIPTGMVFRLHTEP